jgi:putative phage-type endonuclease
MKWTDLKSLDNIIHTFDAKKLDNKNIEDFKETIIYFIEDYIKSNQRDYEKETFLEIVKDNIELVIIETYCAEIIDQLPLDLDIIINECIDLHFLITDTPRSFKKTIIIKNPDIEHVNYILKKVKSKEQPEQRTDAWFDFRHNLLTASSIGHAIGSDAEKNKIIYDKCKPIDKNKFAGTNITSAFHNGHKYEPLSTMIYEKWYDTQIGEFGCIKHDIHKFIGASPDGINIDPSNDRYGRLLEIKNPCSDRKLDGNPKKIYWIQMQIQMEVWDLDECDFFETRFKEYTSESEFNADGTFNETKDGKMKGVLIHFQGIEPIYKYAPIGLTEIEFNVWYEKQMEEKPDNLNWIKNIYWYMDNYSCALVVRNRPWFNTVVPLFQDVWNTILKERKTGYEHRKPQKRQKKKIIINKEAIVTDVPTNNVPANNVPANDVPADDVPANDIPAGDVPANNVPTDDVSANNVPANNVPANNVPVKDGANEFIKVGNTKRKSTPIIIKVDI